MQRERFTRTNLQTSTPIKSSVRSSPSYVICNPYKSSETKTSEITFRNPNPNLFFLFLFLFSLSFPIALSASLSLLTTLRFFLKTLIIIFSFTPGTIDLHRIVFLRKPLIFEKFNNPNPFLVRKKFPFWIDHIEYPCTIV